MEGACVDHLRTVFFLTPEVLGHGADISEGPVGNTYAGFCSSLSLNASRAETAAERGGVVSLVTHLENYGDRAIDEHMHCT